MKAWRIYGPGDIRNEEMVLPVGEGCVKLKVMYTALSLTDNLLYEGKADAEYPLIPGRSCVGMVSETGENVKSLARGDIVAVKSFSACGDCRKCEGGKPHECEHILKYGVNEDGFMRDFVVVGAADVVKLPGFVEPRDAIFLEHIDMAITAISKLDVNKGEYIVIVGATDIGIILAQIALYYQAVPIIVDVRQDFLDKAADLGVYYTVNSMETDSKKRVFALTGGRMAACVAYMTASTLPLSQALEYVPAAGRLAIIGWENSTDEMSAPYSVICDRQLTVFGICSSNNNYISAVNMLANKSVKVAPLIGDEMGFSDVAKAFSGAAVKDKYRKTIIKCSDF